VVVTDRISKNTTGRPAAERAFHHSGNGAEQIARSKPFELFARAGFLARGVIYVVLGILAFGLALGIGGRPANQQGALQAIAQHSLGGVLLILVAAGLAGYSFWRLMRAAVGHGPEGADKGADRVVALASGLAYAGLCAIAIEILLGRGSSSGSPQKPASGVLGWPGGTWLVGIAGGVLICVALYQGYRGTSRDFLDDSKTEQMSRAVKAWLTWIGTFGYLARMVVFGLVGVFLVKAAIDFNPSKAVGVDGALAKLAHASYGPVMLGIVAAGLVAFGVFSLSDARYHRV
jgi:hypothetical protein